jgi:hypothetical protein
MDNNGFNDLKSIHYQTALLEAFDWDEEVLAGFNVWIIESLNSAIHPGELIGMILESYDSNILEIVKKMIKSEIENMHDDRLKRGKIYEA